MNTEIVNCHECTAKINTMMDTYSWRDEDRHTEYFCLNCKPNPPYQTSVPVPLKSTTDYVWTATCSGCSEEFPAEKLYQDAKGLWCSDCFEECSPPDYNGLPGAINSGLAPDPVPGECEGCGKLLPEKLLESRFGFYWCASCDPVEFNGADPKQAAGDKKCPMQLIPTEAERLMAEALACGAKKYGEYNWRKGDGVETMTYVGAIKRHLAQFVDGEDSDDESGICHLGHIMAGCAILIDARRTNKLIDNRPKVD